MRTPVLFYFSLYLFFGINDKIVHNLYALLWCLKIINILNEHGRCVTLRCSNSDCLFSDRTHVTTSGAVLVLLPVTASQWACYEPPPATCSPHSANIRHEGCEIKIPFPLCGRLLAAAHPTWKDQIGEDQLQPSPRPCWWCWPDTADAAELTRQLCLFCATIWRVIKSAANSWFHFVLLRFYDR